MDREVWCAAIQWFAMSQTWLSDWTELRGGRKVIDIIWVVDPTIIQELYKLDILTPAPAFF